jgi:hypothetical protein
MIAKVIYNSNRHAITAQAENPHFLLAHNGTSYLALGNPNHSNYDGYFVKIGGKLCKILYNITPLNETMGMTIDATVVRHAQGSAQEFSLFDDGVLLECNGRFVLTLDCKQLYDESDQGRSYSITESRENQLQLFAIHYAKYLGERQSYDIHVAIATTLRTTRIDRWRNVSYVYDDRRGTHSTPWVYDALQLEGSGTIAVVAASTAADARKRALSLAAMRIRNVAHNDAPALPTRAQLAWRALATLQTRTGIMAGLPWFFQEWSRDELIAMGGLLAARKYDAAISIIDKWYSAVRSDGTLPAIYPDQGLPSADAPGWLGKRTRDLLVRLSDENILHLLSKEKLAKWRDTAGLLLDQCASRLREGLVQNETNTTWMDTASNDDGRAGARIEIQALFLALYDAYAYLCMITMVHVNQQRSERAKQVVESVQVRLVTGDKLLDGLYADGSPDFAVRPNIFLAWYAAPKLFTNEQWQQFFRAALPKLWLDWGGLASLEKMSPNFHSRYTGEDVASYHRGDSWYFVNNIAAMAMHAVDDQGFSHEVHKIIDASLRDLLSQGYVGHCSELSDAAGQWAAGCHAQAWSASTLLEALLKIE